MRTKDWVGLIEAGYDLSDDTDGWLQRILRASAPLFERGRWPTLIEYDFTATTVALRRTLTLGPSLVLKALPATLDAHPGAQDLIYRQARTGPVGTLSELVFSRFPAERGRFRRQMAGLLGDTLGVRALSGTGSGVMLMVGLFRATTPTAKEQKRWPLVASHLGAALRLRRMHRRLSLDAPGVEWIVDASGKPCEARGGARGAAARQQLREAWRRIDRARSRAGRADPDAALEGWEGLIAGRWSLVDHFDSDGRRFAVAIKNDPLQADPRGLTPRERQVAEYAGLGCSSKEIAYTLGVSPSAVTNSTTNAQLKLGLASRVELAAFFAPSGLRAKLAEVALAGEELLVGAYPLIDERRVSNLTPAERAVLAHVLAGSTHADIAARRGASERTVANQIQAIFRKLGVTSKSELAARLQSEH